MKVSLPFSRPNGTQYFYSHFIPSNKSLGYFHSPLTGLRLKVLPVTSNCSYLLNSSSAILSMSLRLSLPQS